MQSETQTYREKIRERRIEPQLVNDMKAQFVETQPAKKPAQTKWVALAIWAVAVAVSARYVTPYMVAATIAYSAMVAGVLNRKNKWAHSRLMGSAMLIDLAIVLSLEFQRSAIKTALGFSLSPLQQFHIGASTVAVALYFPIAYFGLKNYLGKGDQQTRTRHALLGKWAFVFRTIGFLLMFSLLWKKS